MILFFDIRRPRLVNMCKYMGISPYGTDAYLRYMLRKRLRWYGLTDSLQFQDLFAFPVVYQNMYDPFFLLEQKRLISP